MEVGSVWFHKKFKFEDNQEGKKLIIVVSYQKEFCLVCKTTSKEKIPYRIKQRGCNSKYSNFCLFSGEDFFKEDTWIQFKLLYKLRISDLFQEKVKGNLSHITTLKNQTIKAVLSCMLSSEDIQEQYLDTIRVSLNNL